MARIAFFDSKVLVYEENGEIKLDVSIDWKKIKQLSLKIEEGVIQLRMDIEDEKEQLTLYYYIAKQEDEVTWLEHRETWLVPFYNYSPTQFFVKDMNRANILTCITNILFECTPFVFFEGRSVVFPAHRSGLSIVFPAIMKLANIGQESEYISQVDTDFINFINSANTYFVPSLHFQTTFYEDQFYATTDKIRELYFRITERRNGQANIGVEKSFINSKILKNIRKLFSEIEPMEVEITRNNEAEVHIIFRGKHAEEDKSPHEVATYSLSVMPLNIYLELLRWWLDGNVNKQYLLRLDKFPTTILYDEPETSLSPNSIVSLFELLFTMYEKLRERNIPLRFVFISHSL